MVHYVIVLHGFYIVYLWIPYQGFVYNIIKEKLQDINSCELRIASHIVITSHTSSVPGGLGAGSLHRGLLPEEHGAPDRAGEL